MRPGASGRVENNMRTALLASALFAVACGASDHGTLLDTETRAPQDAEVDAPDAIDTSAADPCEAAGCGLQADTYCNPCENEIEDSIINIFNVRPFMTYCDDQVGVCGGLKEDCADGWCHVPAGSFRSGASDVWMNFDNPPHYVVLPKAFAIQQTEVTNADWREIMGATAETSPLRCGDTCPVAEINLFDMFEYSNRLSIRDGFTPCYEMRGCDDGDSLTKSNRSCEMVSLVAQVFIRSRSCSGIGWDCTMRLAM